MPVKLSIENIRESIIPYGLTLLSKEYGGITSDLNVSCDYNHSYSTNYKNIKKTKGCVECRRLEVFKKFSRLVENSNDGHMLITKEEEFTKTSEKLTFLCPKNHVYFITMSHYKEGKRCSNCKGDRISESKRLSTEEILDRYEKRGYQILEGLGEYKNSLSRLIVKCPEGHVYESSVGNFSSGYNCEECFRIEQPSLVPRGVNHSSWKGGISPLKELFRNAITEWKKESMRESNYKCAVTGNKFDHIHHLHPFHKIFDSFIKTNNIPLNAVYTDFKQTELNELINKFIEYHDTFGLGVCLSLEMHNLFHKKYGFNGSKEDFLEFENEYSPNTLDAIYYI